MLKHNVFLLIFLLSKLLIYGQSAYFVKDSVVNSGVNIIAGTDSYNSRFCEIETGNKTTRYTPNEIKEYGFKKGQVYISKKINISDTIGKVFLERLVNDKFILYYYKSKKNKTFYLEKDSGILIEISKKTEFSNYHNELLKYTSDCNQVSKVTKLVQYNKNSFKQFFKIYKNCDKKPFSYRKYGIIFSYGMTKLGSTFTEDIDYIGSFDFKHENEYKIGFFIDNPIKQSDLSLHLELVYSQNDYFIEQQFESQNINFVAETATLNIPMLLRYSFPVNGIRPFINAGAYLNYNFRNESAIILSSINQGIVNKTDISTTSYIPKSQVGYSIGTGIEVRLKYRHCLFIEIRHNKLLGNKNKGTLNKSETEILTGINF